LEDDWFRTALDGPLALSFEFRETSTTSESPQGPLASTPSISNSTSITEVKFNVGEGLLAPRDPGRAAIASWVEDQEEAMNRNWIFDLTHPSLPKTTDEPLPGPTGPEKLLTTMDFLSLKKVVEDD
jgi:hypothetical protein